ncbi:alpha-mannosidase [Terriglobus aquaticus]|uniref:Alpha-mannosidase n=1 Tax=Terriglobus aquaticus TaxID=940139 RepID=A0ABW9KI24_9BACT|nr:alpha-mannosidase [Terriglobus aquaticus]
MIGNAHIDAPWLWPLSEADAIVHSTFRSALDRMKEDSSLTMTTSSSQFYAWVAASDPAMLQEIRAYVKSGRWDLVGGWWVEPDVNMPSGESLIRQGLYGQRTLEKLFGRMADVGYNPDSFGHNGNMPQILKLQGMPYYVFMRPNAIEKPDIRQNLFQWQGIDGTRALTYRVPLFYDDPGDVRSHMLRTVAALAGQPERTDMEFFGIGDHGGGPTKENIRSIRAIQGEKGAPHIFYSTPDRYFSEVHQHLPSDIQVYEGDLQHHSVGTYTAGSARKKLNRTTEAMLISAEKFCALGSFAWGAQYPKADFEKAWERILLLQFHDSMAATTLPEHEQVVRDGYGRARDIATEAMNDSLQRLAWQIPTTDPDSKYIVVFNPHAWAAPLKVEYDLGWEPGTVTAVEDDQGNSIPFQWIDPTAVVNHRQRLVAVVEIPALGYRQIRVRKASSHPSAGNETPRAESSLLENSHLKLTFGQGGTVTLFDKDSRQFVFGGANKGMRAVVFADANDTWAHQVHAYTDEVGEFTPSDVKVLENGPLRARVRQTLHYNASTLSIDWMLYAGSRTVDLRVSLDWHEHLKMLKFSFPTELEKPQATYEIAYGAEHRDNAGLEDPGQRWIDLTGLQNGKQYGLAILNDAKYGYSVSGGDMRVSIARAAVYANHEPRELKPGVDYAWMDQGVQTFSMELMPHAGTWQEAGVVRAAEELVTEVPIVYQGIHPGSRPTSASFLSTDSKDIVVEAVKQSEDGSDLIIRSYETAGHNASATLSVPSLNVRWNGSYHPFEIKTLRLDARTHAVREVDALER